MNRPSGRLWPTTPRSAASVCIASVRPTPAVHAGRMPRRSCPGRRGSDARPPDENVESCSVAAANRARTRRRLEMRGTNSGEPCAISFSARRSLGASRAHQPPARPDREREGLVARLRFRARPRARATPRRTPIADCRAPATRAPVPLPDAMSSRRVAAARPARRSAVQNQPRRTREHAATRVRRGRVALASRRARLARPRSAAPERLLQLRSDRRRPETLTLVSAARCARESALLRRRG